MAELDDPYRLQALHDSGLLRKEMAARFDHLAFTVRNAAEGGPR